MSQMTLCMVGKTRENCFPLLPDFIIIKNQIDEVHLVGQSRGATLEACISRMKVRPISAMNKF